MKVNASAGLRLETAPGFFMTHVAQASISAVLSAVCLTSSVDASADLLRRQTSALATLAKAAITMIAMITVPPKKAMFG